MSDFLSPLFLRPLAGGACWELQVHWAHWLMGMCQGPVVLDRGEEAQAPTGGRKQVCCLVWLMVDVPKSCFFLF